MRLQIAVLFLAATAAAAPSKAENKLRGQLAKVWIDYARACVARGAKTEGQRAIALARRADNKAKDLEKVATSVEALSGDLLAPDETRKRKADKDAAKVCDKLAKHDPAFLELALRLDPSKGRIKKALGKVKQLANNRKNINDAGRMLIALRNAAPDNKTIAKVERDMALKDVAVIRATDHPLVGYLSLPKGWKKGKQYDLLVTVDGAGSNFLGAGRGFAKTRGSRMVIVLAPCTLANTNKLDQKKYPFYSTELLDRHNAGRFAFDLEGLLGLLKIVNQRYGGRDRIAITGFSGGGNLCYGFTLTNPGRVLCAAPACANFSGMGLRDLQRPENGGPPIHIMTGANDPHRDFTFGNKNSPGIEPQSDRAQSALKNGGFVRVKRTMIPGARHSALRAQVWAYYDECSRK